VEAVGGDDAAIPKGGAEESISLPSCSTGNDWWQTVRDIFAEEGQIAEVYPSPVFALRENDGEEEEEEASDEETRRDG
jgi:hypothetical protein